MKGKQRFSNTQQLMSLAEKLIEFSRKCSADEVEIAIADGYEFDVDVRLGNIENLVEAGSRSMGVKIIKDKKTAYATSSDLSEETLERLIQNAVKRAALANPDDCAGLPPLSKDKIDSASLKIFDREIARLDAKKKIALALATEKIALEDKRMTNSHGASFVTNEISTVLASSLGFLQAYDQTYCSLSIGLQAGETDNKAEDSWFTSERFFKDLDPPEEVAKKAVQRTVRLLNSRKIKTQSAPVIFEPMMTSWLLGFLFACSSGTAIYQKASFLIDKLGESIGNEKITVIDDGLMPGKLGSRPFDAEGVASQRTVVVEKGVLKKYLCNTYAGRKLKLASTGNSDGAGVSPNNFYLESGKTTPQEIVASCKKGLILIRTIGHGLNSVTGDISRGAFGLWVENGEIAYPVSEITIAGNLGEILNNIEMVGNDLDFRTPVTGPTIKISELTIAGE